MDGRRGSNVYEVNAWLWQFGRGKPRLGGLTVEETAKRRVAKDADRKKRAAETHQRRKADRAWWKLKCVWNMFVPVSTNIYLVCTLYIHSTNQVYVATGEHGILWNWTESHAVMCQWQVFCNISSPGDYIIPRKTVLSPASTSYHEKTVLSPAYFHW